MTNSGRLFYVPFVSCYHSTLEPIPYEEVQRLEEAEKIRLCSFHDIQQFRGQGVATLCSDPSLFASKLRIVNAGGQMAVMADAGIGLEFSPESPLFSEDTVERVCRFMDKTGKSELKKLLLIGAHYPCGCAQKKALTLEECVNFVAGGARHLKSKGVFTKVVATIFVLTQMPDPNGSVELKWYHIPKNGS